MKFSEGSGKMIRLKNWFFSGRIKKSLEKEQHILTLSEEFDDGKILKIG